MKGGVGDCTSFALGDSLGTKPCVVPWKVALAGDERYLGCAAVAAGVALRCDWFRTVGVAAMCSVHLCVCRSSRVIWNLGLQIAVEWLHECCHGVLPCA